MDRLRAFGVRRDPGVFASLEGAKLLDRRPGEIKIGVLGSFHLKRLQGHAALLKEVCDAFFGRPTVVEISTLEGVTGEAAGAPERAGGTSDRRAREREVRQGALNNPSVNAALEILSAEIVEIKPLRRD